MSLRRKPKNKRFARRHVLDVKLRASHRRQVRFRRFVLVLVFLATIVGGGIAAWRGGDVVLQEFVFRNRAFAIDRLDIATDGVIAREQLRRWAGVKESENLFALDLNRVKRDLELVPAIESAVVERVLPHTLRIRVVEREAVASVSFERLPGNGAEQRYLLDRLGNVMFPLEPEQLSSADLTPSYQLPGLLGLSSNDLRPGRRLADERVRAALQLIDAFNRSGMVGVTQLEQIDLRTPGILQLRTSDKCQVVFGLNDFEGQMGRWRVIHEHGRQFGRQMITLDLSVTNNVPVRWLEANASGARLTSGPGTLTLSQ